MSDGDIQRKINTAKMAVLPLPEAQRFFNDVANSLAKDNEATGEPYGPYVARHLGALLTGLIQFQRLPM